MKTTYTTENNKSKKFNGLTITAIDEKRAMFRGLEYEYYISECVFNEDQIVILLFRVGDGRDRLHLKVRKDSN